ncbi:hypothetical protein TNCV_1668561 [Trichonephila clavipes]|nr:hypothetical protein TNCV_1668561 [Trichonephila clavipes]
MTTHLENTIKHHNPGTYSVLRTAVRFNTLVAGPSHVDLEGKEIADTLAKAGACEAPELSAHLPFWRISQELNTSIRPLALSPQSTISISVLVLKALWIMVLIDRNQLF